MRASMAENEGEVGEIKNSFSAAACDSSLPRGDDDANRVTIRREGEVWSNPSLIDQNFVEMAQGVIAHSRVKLAGSSLVHSQ